MKSNNIIVGITGLPGAGKSLVVEKFQEKGAIAIKADNVGHELLDDSQLVEIIANKFGKDILENGKISRRKLADIVFSSKERIAELEQIIHPEVTKKISEIIDSHMNKVIIIEAALLHKGGLDKICDHLILIDATFETRLKRIASRGWDKEELIKRESNIIEQDITYDIVINNNLSTGKLYEQIDQVWNQINTK